MQASVAKISLGVKKTTVGSIWFKSNLKTVWVIVIRCQLALTWCYSIESIYWWVIWHQLADSFAKLVSGSAVLQPGEHALQRDCTLLAASCKRAHTNSLQLQDEPKHDPQPWHHCSWTRMWTHSVPVFIQETAKGLLARGRGTWATSCFPR